MNEQIFMLGAVATASTAHYRIHNSTCPECAFPIMLIELPNEEHFGGGGQKKNFHSGGGKNPYAWCHLP